MWEGRTFSGFIIAGSIWMTISKWAIRMAKKFGEGISGMRPLVLCACKVWYRIWGRLRLRKVSVRAA